MSIAEAAPDDHGNNPLGSRHFYEMVKNIIGMSSVSEVDSPIFNLGIDSEDMVFDGHVNGRRVYSWKLNGNERRLAPIAGWNRYEHLLEEERHGFICLPEGTRNATSILAGMEAFSGEKSEIVNAAARYIRGARRVLGYDDTRFAWTSLAVTPEHEYFVAPPHVASETRPSKEVVERWHAALERQLSVYLEDDERNKDLVARFHQSIIEE